MTEATGADAHLKLAVLFTAFDEAGDAIAAPVIHALAARAPELALAACGGPAMHAAGAQLLERTVADGGDGSPALFQGLTTRRRIRMLEDWVAGHRVAVHVAVAAPVANRPVVRATSAAGVRVVHLVAPPLWKGGGRFRLGSLRKQTSMVLCTLPFEEEWFKERDVPARFIGHPAINRTIDLEVLRQRMYGLPQGAPRLGILPGLAPRDIRANTRLLVEAYAELQARHAGLCGVIVATTQEQARLIKRKLRVFPTGLHLTISPYAPVIAWSDLVLATGGEAVLEVMVQRKPMIGVYRTGPIPWLLSMVRRSGWHLLPNIIAEHEVVPEFVPHFGGAAPIVKQATRILLDSKHAAIQSEELHRVCLRFANHRPAEEAAKAIIEVIQRKADGAAPNTIKRN